jgi:hypothetical protein
LCATSGLAKELNEKLKDRTSLHTPNLTLPFRFLRSCLKSQLLSLKGRGVCTKRERKLPGSTHFIIPTTQEAEAGGS